MKLGLHQTITAPASLPACRPGSRHGQYPACLLATNIALRFYSRGLPCCRLIAMFAFQLRCLSEAVFLLGFEAAEIAVRNFCNGRGLGRIRAESVWASLYVYFLYQFIAVCIDE